MNWPRLCKRFISTAKLTIKDRDIAINTPSELLAAVLDQGRNGVALQRIRGWGNEPEQLWQTTLDKDARSFAGKSARCCRKQ